MKKLFAGGMALGLLGFTSSAQAEIMFTFGTEFSGSGSSLSGPVVVTIDDGGGSGSVDVTIDSTGLDGSLSEYISGLYLNLNPAKDPTALGVGIDGGAIDPSSFTFGTDCCKADGDGFYDIQIDWPSAGASRFEADLTDVITFSLAGLVEEDFYFLSAPAGGSGPFYAALRAGSLDANGEGSGWFYPTVDIIITQDPVPEPASLALFGFGLAALGLGLHRRRARRL